MQYPLTLFALFLAAVMAIMAVITTHGPTINGAGFLALLFLIAAAIAGPWEHAKANRTPRR